LLFSKLTDCVRFGSSVEGLNASFQQKKITFLITVKNKKEEEEE
jgi:hypothetical protein